MSNIKTLNYIMENLDASSEAVAPALKNVFRVYNSGTGNSPGKTSKFPEFRGGDGD